MTSSKNQTMNNEIMKRRKEPKGHQGQRKKRMQETEKMFKSIQTEGRREEEKGNVKVFKKVENEIKNTRTGAIYNERKDEWKEIDEIR